VPPGATRHRNSCVAIAKKSSGSTRRVRYVFGNGTATRPKPPTPMSDPIPSAVDAGHAWSTLPRRDPSKRSASSRVSDFLEIYGLYDEAAAREQASRCVQCPEPTCVAGCPLGSNIPEWLALTAEGHFQEAATALHASGNLPEICARVCPADHLCEAMCVISGRAQPVSIWAVEQFLNEYAFAHGVVSASVGPPNGWRVAVIGAGPGGLACADGLVRRGFAVTVFDWRLQPGGLLVYGTPAFHLERSIVQRRVDILRQQGVEFRLGVSVGQDVALSELLTQFDAVYLALGAKKPRTLAVPGIELRGVSQAVPFIVQTGAETAPDTSSIAVAGKRVAVLGGGDTAVDCARTAIRCGAKDVTVIYRRDEGSMPCMGRDYESAVEESARFVFQAMPVELVGNAHGEVTGVRLIRTEVGAADGDGRRPFEVRPGTEFTVEADIVFLALGFELEPLPPSSPFRVLASGFSGKLAVDARRMTSVAGIFAGGDLVRGPCTALHAVRDARRAVAGIEAFLAAQGRCA
jgi:glutamate synthase (NADPH) small chain